MILGLSLSPADSDIEDLQRAPNAEPDQIYVQLSACSRSELCEKDTAAAAAAAAPARLTSFPFVRLCVLGVWPRAGRLQGLEELRRRGRCSVSDRDQEREALLRRARGKGFGNGGLHLAEPI